MCYSIGIDAVVADTGVAIAVADYVAADVLGLGFGRPQLLLEKRR